MPLDLLQAPTSLRILAAPVPQEVLTAHRDAQLRRFAPSFWHQHQGWLPVGLIGSVGCMATSGGVANSMLPGSPLPSWLVLFWFSVMALLIVFGVFRASAGARWEERAVPPEQLDMLGVPMPIIHIARDVQRETPGSVLILGELLREDTVVDPYLLLEWGGERVCLGIWDERGVLAQAGCTHSGSDPLTAPRGGEATWIAGGASKPNASAGGA